MVLNRSKKINNRKNNLIIHVGVNVVSHIRGNIGIIEAKHNFSEPHFTVFHFSFMVIIYVAIELRKRNNWKLVILSKYCFCTFQTSDIFGNFTRDFFS